MLPTCIWSRTACNERQMAHRQRDRKPAVDREPVFAARRGAATGLRGGAICADRPWFLKRARGRRILVPETPRPTRAPALLRGPAPKPPPPPLGVAQSRRSA